MKLQPGLIIHTDDDPDDRMLVKDALLENGIEAELLPMEDGEQLLKYLRGNGKHSDGQNSHVPTIILLDLNMPRKDGRETLRELKADPKLRHIPVVVLTTSQAEEDISKTYELGVNSFIIKPSSFPLLVQALGTVVAYWFQTVQLPPEKNLG